jgi:hypothetical protein
MYLCWCWRFHLTPRIPTEAKHHLLHQTAVPASSPSRSGRYSSHTSHVPRNDVCFCRSIVTLSSTLISYGPPNSAMRPGECVREYSRFRGVRR